MDLRKFDRRILERNLSKGNITPKEYKKHLADLVDLAEDHETIEINLYDKNPPEEATDQQEPESPAPAEEMPPEGES